MASSRLKDLTGMTFGKWIVIQREANNKKRSARWLCECQCEKKTRKIVTGELLLRGESTSCGCSRNHNTYNIKDDYCIVSTKSGIDFIIDIDSIDKIKEYSWCIGTNGYPMTVITYNNKKQYMLLHRLLMNVENDTNSNEIVVDHINGNRMDNRKQNLRIATRSQNSMNARMKSNNTSGVVGVSKRNTKSDAWQAGITVNGKQIYLGTFDNLESAIKARQEAEILYFGEYRYKNIDNEN